MANGRWTYAHDADARVTRALRVRARARRAPGRAWVGAAIWQTPGGVVAELDKANSDFNVFQQEIKETVLSQGYPAKTTDLSDLYIRAWIPLLQGWQAFYAKNRGWTDNFWWNHAPEAEQFIDQLIDVRATAAKKGMRILSPPPTRPRGSLLFDPEHNLVDDTADRAKKELDDLMKILKVGLVAGLGLVGVMAVMSARARGAFRRA
jgi:hypothetical protein